MKKYLLTLLLIVPVITQAAIGDTVKNAVNNSSTETQDAVLQARKKAITTGLNGAITAVAKVNTAFQANTQFTTEQKSQAQDLADTTTTALNTQIDNVATATSNEQLDEIRQAAVETLKSYEDEFKALLKQATESAYTEMIAAAKEVIKGMEALVPVFKATKQDTTAFEAQIDLCNVDIAASDTAFYTAMNTQSPTDLKASAQAIATLGQDLAKLVEMADEMAQ